MFLRVAPTTKVVRVIKLSISCQNIIFINLVIYEAL